MKIIKNIKIEYDIYATRCMNQRYKMIKNIRLEVVGKDSMDGFERCVKCEHIFKDDDIPWIAFSKTNGNKLFCEKCAKEFLKDGKI